MTKLEQDIVYASDKLPLATHKEIAESIGCSHSYASHVIKRYSGGGYETPPPPLAQVELQVNAVPALRANEVVKKFKRLAA